MAGIGGLYGEGSIASQFLLWSVAYALTERLLEPALAAVEQASWTAGQQQVLTPADLADQVVRNIRPLEEAATEAAKSGINAERFRTLVDGAGEPPGLEFVMQALRRGFIAEGGSGPGVPSLENAVLTSRVYNYWLPTVLKMLSVPLPPADAVNAVLRGQIPHDQGVNEAYASGVDADRFRILLDSAGRPPSPGELVTLLRRRLIEKAGTGPSATTFQQGIFEGDTKDKWWELFAALEEEIPPPRTVTALVRAGAIDRDTALRWFQDAGLTPDTAAAYFKGAQGEKLAGTRQLAQSSVLTLYESQAIDTATALDHLRRLGYGDTEAKLLLELADLQREVRALNSAITRIGGYYVAHHITRQGVISGLAALKLDTAHINGMLAVWDAEAAANVRQVTPAQVMTDVYYNVISPQQGLADLQKLGYSARGAWLALAARLHGTTGLGPEPPAGGPGVI